MSLLPHYQHIINPKLKHIYLSFNAEGVLIIKSPKVTTQEIEKILIKKSTWINKSREKIRNKKGKRSSFQKKSELYFLGKAYTLELIAHEKKVTKLMFDSEGFKLYYHTYNEVLFQKYIDTFYKQKSFIYIPRMVDIWAEEMGLAYRKISFRKTKHQWGSCSFNDALSFNTMMMKLPLNVIEYIIVHELSHIQYKHHQKDFWQMVANYLPSYKLSIAELKQYTT